MKDDFEKAATKLKGKAILADVDATTEEQLAKEYNIEGFPTLKLFSQGQVLVDYKGNRDEKSMIDFIERASKPAFVNLENEKQVEEWKKDKTEKTLMIGIEIDQEARKKFTRAVFTLKDILPDSVDFANVDKAELIKVMKGKTEELSVKKGDFVLVKSDGDTVVYDSGKFPDLEKWVKSESTPLFGEFTQANADMYTELPHPMCVMFTPESKKDTKTMDIVKSVAMKKKGSGKLSFAWVDNEKLDNFQDYVGLKGRDPAVCIYSFEDDMKYTFPEDQKFDESTFEQWIDDFIAGKLEPMLKSQTVPEKNDDPVKVVVGDSWKDIVEDESKDVLISQTAPWCGHCQAMKPVYEKVAKALEGVDSVVVANMDATENDAPAAYKAQGFPTLQFFPAGKGAKMVEYDGDRSSKDLIEFMMKNAGKRFEFDVKTLGDDPEPEEEPEDEEPEDEEPEGEEGEAGEEAKEEQEAKTDPKEEL